MHAQLSRQTAPQGPVEIILGFRPGKDRLPLPTASRIAIRQEGADIVVDRGPHGLVVLQGISLIELVAGVETQGRA